MNEVANQTNKIKGEFYPTHAPSTTQVEYKNGETFYGFFQDFHDSNELSEKGQCRFIPNNNAIAFRDVKLENGNDDPNQSIIVDLTLTKSIKLVQNGVILKQVNLN